MSEARSPAQSPRKTGSPEPETEIPDNPPYNERPVDKVADSPPVIRLPCCPRPFKTVEMKPLCSEKIEVVTGTNRCQRLVARLQKEKVLALAAEGIHIGKEGPITLLQIGTCSGHVYVFDVLENRDLIVAGRLKQLLEDEHVQKVIHDSSQLNAALEYQFATTLSNVFDTQVAHLVISRHKGRRLAMVLKLPDLVVKYTNDVEKYAIYEWRNDTKVTWMSMIGNFWATRPLTADMVEFAASDVIMLVPDVYRQQSDYLEKYRLQAAFKSEVANWLLIDIDGVVREKHGKHVSNQVMTILREMDSKYDDRVSLFNVLDKDEVSALALSTYEDACSVSKRIGRLKTALINRELDALEVAMRTDTEAWQQQTGNILEYLRYYQQLPNEEISQKSAKLLQSIVDSILEHTEEKYNIDATTNMLTLSERDSILTIPYSDVVAGKAGRIVTELFWRLMHEEIHGMINFLRFSPTQFYLTEKEYAKVVYFAEDSSGAIPEEVASLAAGLIHALRAYSASNGSYAIDIKRRHSAAV